MKIESKEFIAEEIAKMFAIALVVILSSELMGKLLTAYQITGEVAVPMGMVGIIVILFSCCAISRIEEIASWGKAKKIVAAIITTAVMVITVIIATTAVCIVLDRFYYLFPCTIWELIMLGLFITAAGTTVYVMVIVAISEQASV